MRHSLYLQFLLVSSVAQCTQSSWSIVKMWFAIELETKTKKQKRQLHRGVEEKDEEKEGKEEHEQEQEEQDEVTMWYLFLAFLQILSMYRFSPAPQTASNSTRLMMNCFSILILRLGGSADMRCTPSYVKRKKNIYILILYCGNFIWIAYLELSIPVCVYRVPLSPSKSKKKM